MVLSRRMFGLAAAAAPAVGPGVVKEFVEQSDVAQKAARMGALTQAPLAYTPLAGQIDKANSLLDIWKNELASLLGIDRASLVGDAMRQVSRFDPDLLVNNSLSLIARIRLQAERNIERDFEARRKSLTEKIAERVGARP